MFSSFLLLTRHCCGPALCLEKASHLPARENARHEDEAQERNCVGTGGSRTSNSKARAGKGKKGDCMSTAWQIVGK